MKDFLEFSEANSVSPSQAVSEKILNKVSKDLDPALSQILFKVFFVYLVAGAFTLLFCPQFGINLTGGMGLMSLFMRLGEGPCMLACGGFFMASGSMFAVLVLRPEDLRKLRKAEWIWVPLLSLVLMSSLVCLGGEFLLSVALFWLAGSVVGGIATLEAGWILRKCAQLR
jgi:hypothetical protein